MRPELIRATDLLRRNTPEAVEEAIGLLQNTVYSFSMKVCGHPEDAEDTMQEVLSRSIGHLAKIQTPQQMAVWLYTVTRNRCWRMRRKPADDAELGRMLQDAAKGPEGELLAAEQHHLLHQAILRIAAPLRIVLVLHDMEELTTEQVAQILSLKQGTVRIRLHRARLSVRKEMNQLLRGTPEHPENAKRLMNVVICLPTSPNTWMAEWNRLPANGCANISRHARPAWHFCANCAPPSIAAGPSRFPVTRLSRLDCAPSLHGNTCACWFCRSQNKHPRFCNESPLS